jgi:hypothetical protein
MLKMVISPKLARDASLLLSFHTKGVELEGFTAAYRHACGLVHQVRIRFSDADEDWWI